MYVAFEALCPNGHQAMWSASCPMSVLDTPIVTYNIRCPACTHELLVTGATYEKVLRS